MGALKFEDQQDKEPDLELAKYNIDMLETLQEKIARQYGFEILHHRMELYGRCLRCSEKRRMTGRKR